MNRDVVLRTQAGGVLTLRLNRPKVLNALTPDVFRSLRAALQEAADTPSVRCVVLAASGRAFSAGADVGALEKLRRDGSALGAALCETLHPVLLSIRALEKPVLAAIQGVAAGGGASLALACDLRVMSEDATLVCPFAKLGLVPSGLSGELVRRLGLARALEHAWTGKPIDATEALACGLVNAVVPAYRVESATYALAAKLLEAAPRALAMTKRAMVRAAGGVAGWKEELEYEAQLQDALCRTRDHAEGLAAFLEKRAPSFTGE